MTNSVGDGELSLAVELKEFSKFDVSFNTEEDATILATALNNLYPNLETTISKRTDSSFMVWYRHRT